MTEQPEHTDDELVAMADQEGLWIIRAGGAVMACPGTLRRALEQAKTQSLAGEPLTRITRTPVDDPSIDAHQITRLWVRLGI